MKLLNHYQKEIAFVESEMKKLEEIEELSDLQNQLEETKQALVQRAADIHRATPVCTALIELASAALGRDLRPTGRTLERLGKENVARIIREGR